MSVGTAGASCDCAGRSRQVDLRLEDQLRRDGFRVLGVFLAARAIERAEPASSSPESPPRMTEPLMSRRSDAVSQRRRRPLVVRATDARRERSGGRRSEVAAAFDWDADRRRTAHATTTGSPTRGRRRRATAFVIRRLRCPSDIRRLGWLTLPPSSTAPGPS